jgi:5'(3')-deoxyribonucleotidase
MSEPFVLGVDLDGVCADYTLAFRAVAAEELGVDVSALPLERSWDFHEWGFGPGDYERIHRVAVLDRRILRELPAVEGAADALWRLSDSGVWIRVITHRLYVNWGHAISVSDTVTWLDWARIPYRDICFLGAKPEVEADAYIDDAPHNVAALRALGNDVIVFDQPYNQGVDGPRASNLGEVEELVEAMEARRTPGVQRQLPGLDAGADRIARNRPTRD